MAGFFWGIYVADDGEPYLMKVDTDFFLQPARGWQEWTSPSMRQFPRGWRARRVIGLNAVGQPREAICATVLCDLWTGAVRTFDYRDTWGNAQMATVIARHQERRYAVR